MKIADKSPKPNTPRSDEVRTWAAERFAANGGTVDMIIAAGIDEFFTDKTFAREFLIENLRSEVVAGVTGLMRTREFQTLYPDSLLPSATPVAPVKTGPVRTEVPAPVVVEAEKPPRPAKVRTQAKDRDPSPGWAKALAVDPDRRTFRPLLALTREELLTGSSYLRVRSEVLAQVAALLKPGQRVGESMTEQELNDLVARLSSNTLPEPSPASQKRPALVANGAKPYRETFAEVGNGSGAGKP